MKRYKQLTIEQRYQIYGLKNAGFDQSEIAGELKVNKSTNYIHILCEMLLKRTVLGTYPIGDV